MRDNVFCTIAFGSAYHELAQFLCADLTVYSSKILVLTDAPEKFQGFPHVIAEGLYPSRFSFHLKKEALKRALDIGTTAVFVDADTCVHFSADRRLVARALRHEFPPGLHASRLFPAGHWPHPDIEAFAHRCGYQFDPEIISYWEGLFALSDCKGLEEFFRVWASFEEEHKRIGHNGSGEGACIGIAAAVAGLEKSFSFEMLQSNLPFVLWPVRLPYKSRKALHARFALKEMLQGNFNFRMHAYSLR